MKTEDSLAAAGKPLFLPDMDKCINRRARGKALPRLAQKLKNLLKYLGPAFIVSVAYIDPGNFATNISGGSKYNLSLVWVILWSSLAAMFLQAMSARLGIATDHNLPQMCGRIYSRKTNWFLWVVAELAAMATDLAEFLGGTLGLYLLFRIPLVYSGIITGILTFIIVYLGKYGQRVIEIIIGLLIAVISVAYTIELFLSKPDWGEAALHTLIPSIPDSGALLIAVGMLGATVMPHAIFLHSQLVQCRNGTTHIEEKKKHYKMEWTDILIAMNIAFIINAAMVIVSASVFYRNGVVVETIEEAQKSLYPLLGKLSEGVFGIALLASGLSSSVVGTMAGQTIMQGFVDLKISDNITRLITMAPGMLIIILGMNPMKALILSQVMLSFVLPAAIIPMLKITSCKDLMGPLVNKPSAKYIGWTIAIIIILMNLMLLFFAFTGNL